jgi:hypothetical protein
MPLRAEVDAAHSFTTGTQEDGIGRLSSSRTFAAEEQAVPTAAMFQPFCFECARKKLCYRPGLGVHPRVDSHYSCDVPETSHLRTRHETGRIKDRRFSQKALRVVYLIARS